MDHDREDPLSQFFPGEEDVDLYNVIGVAREATQEEIRKAYRRQALVHHPDKQIGASEEVRVNASVKFQQLGFAYAVLGDEKRRKRYNSTGSTEEALPLEEGEDGWNAYFKDLFDRVTKTRLDEDKKAYQGPLAQTDSIFYSFIHLR
jgi:DnaJ family protein C protein 9